MAEYEIERVCPVCSKHFDVLYKDLWAYKKARAKGGYDFYCTWKCLRAAETNKTKKPEPVPEKRENKDRLAVLKDLMDALCDGQDAYDYLRDMGYTDPKDTLRKLRTTAKKEAPDIYQTMKVMGLLDLRKGHSGKGVDKMSKHKLTREQKEKAVELALSGGDYLAHLKECGAKNASAAWWYIRKTLEKSNPELLEQINQKTGEQAEVEVAEKLPPEAVAEVPEADPLAGFVPVSLGGPVAMTREEHKAAHQKNPEQTDLYTKRLQQLAGAQEKPEGFTPVKLITVPAGFDIVSIRGEFGEYRTAGNKFHFANMTKIMYIEIHKDDLAAFMNELKEAAQILGVNVG